MLFDVLTRQRAYQQRMFSLVCKQRHQCAPLARSGSVQKLQRCYHQTKDPKSILLSSTAKTASEYSIMSLNALKNECKRKGLKVSGRKIELVNRLTSNDKFQEVNAYHTASNGRVTSERYSSFSESKRSKRSQNSNKHEDNTKEISNSSKSKGVRPPKMKVSVKGNIDHSASTISGSEFSSTKPSFVSKNKSASHESFSVQQNKGSSDSVELGSVAKKNSDADSHESIDSHFSKLGDSYLFKKASSRDDHHSSKSSDHSPSNTYTSKADEDTSGKNTYKTTYTSYKNDHLVSESHKNSTNDAHPSSIKDDIKSSYFKISKVENGNATVKANTSIPLYALSKDKQVVKPDSEIGISDSITSKTTSFADKSKSEIPAEKKKIPYTKVEDHVDHLSFPNLFQLETSNKRFEDCIEARHVISTVFDYKYVKPIKTPKTTVSEPENQNAVKLDNKDDVTSFTKQVSQTKASQTKVSQNKEVSSSESQEKAAGGPSEQCKEEKKQEKESKYEFEEVNISARDQRFFVEAFSIIVLYWYGMSIYEGYKKK